MGSPVPQFDVMAANFATMSEFCGYFGCCGGAATLMGLHTRDANRWPLTFAALHAQVSEQIADGYADAPQGTQNIYSVYRWLRQHEGVPATVAGWDTSQGGIAFDLDTLHQTLKDQIKQKADGSYYWGRPVVIEISHTGTGLPEDEHGVQYHFIVIGGYRGPGIGWYRGDGDAVSYNDGNGGLRPPILTYWSEILTAQPVGYCVIDIDPPEAQENQMLTLADVKGFYTADPQDNTRWLGSNGKRLWGSNLNYFQTHNGMAQFGLVLVEEFNPDPTNPTYVGRATIGERSVIVYDPEHKWDHPAGETHPQCYTAHMGTFADKIAANLIAALQSADAQKIQTLTSQITALQQQLANVPKEPPVPPTPAPPAPPTPTLVQAEVYARILSLLDALGVSHTDK